MPLPQRRFELQQPVVVDVGCGCRQSKFSTLFSSSSSSLKQRIPLSPSSTISSSNSPLKKAKSGRKGEEQRTKKKKRGGIAEESVAVAKESLNPYIDFYESMLVMIMEKEIYDWKDLCDLLHRYLSLNSSCHHQIILRAFVDIWNDVFSPAAEDAGGSTAMTEIVSVPRNRSGNEFELCGKLNVSNLYDILLA